MRPLISIKGCVRPSIRWSIDPLVRRSVTLLQEKHAENGVVQDEDASYVMYTALFLGLSYRNSEQLWVTLDNFFPFFFLLLVFKHSGEVASTTRDL